MSVNIFRSIVLVIIFLVLSCEEYLLPIEIEGCITNSACNYNAEATVDNGSCITPQGCNQWCEGDTTTIAVFDCLSICGGDAIIDACNNCGGDCVADENEFFSCTGNVNNLIKADVCGVCGGFGIPAGKCDCDGNVADCAGVCGGSAVEDECDVCNGDGPDEGYDCDGNCTNIDCAGVCGGSSVVDECGVCGGDNSTCKDCNGDINGTAYIDGCGVCVGGNTILDACSTDCADVAGGTSFYDNCDICVPEGDTTCIQGCDGIWKNDGSQAVLDECDVCNGDGPEEYYDCDGNYCQGEGEELDCAGVCGGSAVEDECGECGGDGIPEGECDCDGNVADCAGVCGGSSVIDECGVCGGDNSTCKDCNGDINGTAYIDGCGVCVGGNTILDACSTDCADVLGGTSFYDNCGICVPEGDTSCIYGCDGIWKNDGSQVVLDVCDVCGGSGIPDGECDCDGNVLGCDGVCNSGLVYDDCDVCAGGNADKDCSGICNGSAELDECGSCEGNNDCFGCSDWYMDNFICDAGTDNKCCQEDPTNSDSRCLILQNAYCEVSTYCQLEFEMECDEDGEYCNYDGAYIEAPCSTDSGSFTEGIGECVKKCDAWLSDCDDITCDELEYCDYAGAVVGASCSTVSGSFTEGVGECMLNIENDEYHSTGYITYYNTGCDGTDDCCTEPACDEPFTLSLEYIDENTLQVNYSSTEEIGGFQFDLDGATSTGGSGGDAAANNLELLAMGTTVLSFDQGGGSIPAGSGILTNLDVTITSTENLCLKDPVISDPVGGAINTCPEYWQLTCIAPPSCGDNSCNGDETVATCPEDCR